MTRRFFAALFALLTFVATQANAKIVRNSDPASVTYHGIRFQSHPGPKSAGRDSFYFDSEWIQATEIKTGKVLWDVAIFRKFIRPIVEADTQWVFIERMCISNGKLIAYDGRSRIYGLDLKTRVVRRLK